MREITKAFGYVRVSLDENPIKRGLPSGSSVGEKVLSLSVSSEDVGASDSKPVFECEGFRKLLDVKTLVVYDLTKLDRDLLNPIEIYKRLLEE